MMRSSYLIVIITTFVAILAIALTYQETFLMRALWSQQHIRLPNQARNFDSISRTITTQANPTMSGTEQTNTANPQEQHKTDSDGTPLPLPPPPSGEEASKLDLSSGEATVKMDALGPLVVNQDGMLSRIENWGQMTELERKNTLEILGKRNQARQEALKAKETDGNMEVEEGNA